jgi:hypothetical protein
MKFLQDTAIRVTEFTQTMLGRGGVVNHIPITAGRLKTASASAQEGCISGLARLFASAC